MNENEHPLSIQVIFITKFYKLEKEYYADGSNKYRLYNSWDPNSFDWIEVPIENNFPEET